MLSGFCAAPAPSGKTGLGIPNLVGVFLALLLPLLGLCLALLLLDGAGGLGAALPIA